MGKIAYFVAASLDGYIADADGGVGWLPEGNPDDYGYADFYGRVEALVMGRRTYDQVVGFGQWPYPGKPTYVFTGAPPADGPPDVHFVHTDPASFAQTVGARHPGTVWLVGGANLAEQFRSAGLIDEYLVFVMPIILGRGVPLFGGNTLFGGNAPPTPLHLEAVQAYDNGMVELRYRPAGAG